jgi:hypothetical protein
VTKISPALFSASLSTAVLALVIAAAPVSAAPLKAEPAAADEAVVQRAADASRLAIVSADEVECPRVRRRLWVEKEGWIVRRVASCR